MVSNGFEPGDLVWWTMGGHKPLAFANNALFLGIVVRVAKERQGVEVYWFNNNTFTVMNCDTLLHAKDMISKTSDNRAK